MSKECILYKKLKENKVQCLACAHKCIISQGKTGICRVRENIDGRLFLIVYGRIASMNKDPIEKKPIYRFMPQTYAFSIGTVGCNFKCDFCQNYNISQVTKNEKKFIFGEKFSPEQIVEMAIKTECKSIAYTYNEPAIFIEFVKDCSVIAKEKGLKNILVTNGYFTKESFDYIKDFIDAINIDLKGDEDFYKKFCFGNQKKVLENIKRFYDYGIHVEITTLIIPDENDSDNFLIKAAKFISSVSKDIPWHITRFFPKYKMTHKKITPIETMKRAEKIGKQAGLKYVYLGNI